MIVNMSQSRIWIIPLVVLVILGIWLFSPAANVGATLEDEVQQSIQALQVRINGLLEEVKQLQEEIARIGELKKQAYVPPVAPGATVGVCPRINFTLRRGSTDQGTGGEVSILQRFLARDSSLYPEGLVTGFFGPLTEQAVKRYQAHKGIVSSGTPETTGFGQVGPLTRKSIQEDCPAVSISVVTDKASYDVNEKIEITVVAQNGSSKPLQLNFQTSCQATFSIFAVAKEEVQITNKQVCAQVLTSVQVPASGFHSWKFLLLNPNLDPGRHIVVAEIPNYGGDLAAFEVQAGAKLLFQPAQPPAISPSQTSTEIGVFVPTTPTVPTTPSLFTPTPLSIEDILKSLEETESRFPDYTQQFYSDYPSLGDPYSSDTSGLLDAVSGLGKFAAPELFDLLFDISGSHITGPITLVKPSICNCKPGLPVFMVSGVPLMGFPPTGTQGIIRYKPFPVPCTILVPAGPPPPACIPHPKLPGGVAFPIIPPDVEFGAGSPVPDLSF